MFALDAAISEQYEHSYISIPVSSVTKLKQLSEHAVMAASSLPNS